MNGSTLFSNYNPYQAYIRKKITPKKVPNNFHQVTPNTDFNDSGTLSNISYLNNNNTSSNFLDLTDPLDFKGFSDLKSKRDRENRTKQSEDRSVPKTNGRNRYIIRSDNLGTIKDLATELALSKNDNGNTQFDDCEKAQNGNNVFAKNIGTFSFKNLLSQKNQPSEKNNRSSSMAKINVSDFSKNDSQYEYYNNGNGKCIACYSTKVVTETKDDLTPIPKRRNSKKLPYGEYDYDYNQAKSAAILIRRLEYSYNLRLCKQYKRYEKQIVYIQRFWRNYMERQNQLLLNKLIQDESRKIRIENAVIQFMKRVSKVFYNKKKKMAFKKLKRKFAVLARSNYLGKFVNRIIRAYKKYKWRKNKKAKRKLKMMLNFTRKKFFYHRIFMDAHDFDRSLYLIRFLQIYFRNYLFRTSEGYRLYLGREVHPNLYYIMKYRNNRITREIKIQNFADCIKRWKYYLKCRKDVRIIKFMKIMNSVFYREYFTIFITQVIKKTNSLLTFYLLQPRTHFLTSIYFRFLVGQFFKEWKSNSFLLKKVDLLGLNLVKKIFKIYWFKPVINKLKRRKYFLQFVRIFSLVLSKKIVREARETLNFLILTTKCVSENIIVVKQLHLKHFSLNISTKKICYYFNKWRNTNKEIGHQITFHTYSQKKGLNSVIKTKKIKHFQKILKHFYLWRKQIYMLVNYETKTSFFLQIIKNKIKKYISRIIFSRFIDNELNNMKKIQLHLIFNSKEKKFIKQLQFYFVKWFNIYKTNFFVQNADKIGLYCKKKVETNKKKNIINALKKVVARKNNKIIGIKKNIFNKLIVNTKLYNSNKSTSTTKNILLCYLLENLSTNQTQKAYDFYIKFDKFEFWKKHHKWEQFKKILCSPKLQFKKPKNAETIKYLYYIKWIRQIKHIKIIEKVRTIQGAVRKFLKRKECNLVSTSSIISPNTTMATQMKFEDTGNSFFNKTNNENNENINV